MNPYTFTEIKDMENNSRDILYDFTRLELPQSLSNMSVKSEKSKKSYIHEKSKIKTKFDNFRPKFTSASRISLSTKSSLAETKPQDRTVKSSINQFMTNKLKIQGDELQNLMDRLENMKKNDKKNYNPVVEEKDYLKKFNKLKNKYEENERNFTLMRRLKKMYGKMYTTNADKALAYIKSGRMMDKRDMEYALEKIYKKQMRDFKKKNVGFSSQQQTNNNVVIRRRRRPPPPRTESSDESSSSSEEEEMDYQNKKLSLMEIEKKAEEIVKRKLAQAMPKNKPRQVMNNQPHQDLVSGIEEDEERIVKLPNGMTLIKPDNPNDPPMIIMPEDDNMSSRLSNTISSDFSRKNMMKEYMDNMMTLKMMQMMKNNEEREEKEMNEEEKKEKIYQIGEKKKKKKKKKRRKPKLEESFVVTKPPANSEFSTVKPGNYF